MIAISDVVPAAETAAPDPVIQLIGAVSILLAYLALQLGRTGPRRTPYLAANTLSAGLLAFEAARTEQIGFLLLEGTWALVSLITWIRVLRTRR